jgi:putative FmdB family regulatory protein
LRAIAFFAMPIYEYACRSCGHEFEQLIRTGDTAACPSCKGQDLERLLLTGHHELGEHAQAALRQARAKAKLVQRDKDVAQAEYEKKHREEALGPAKAGLHYAVLFASVRPSTERQRVYAVMSGCSGVIEM